MVTVCEVLYVPAPGLKVGVAVPLLPEDELLPPHPTIAKTPASAIATTVERPLTIFSRTRTDPPENYGLRPGGSQTAHDSVRADGSTRCSEEDIQANIPYVNVDLERHFEIGKMNYFRAIFRGIIWKRDGDRHSRASARKRSTPHIVGTIRFYMMRGRSRLHPGKFLDRLEGMAIVGDAKRPWSIRRLS